MLSGYFELVAMGLALGNISSGNRYKWMITLIFPGTVIMALGNFISIVN